MISTLKAVNATKETCYAFLKKGGVVALVVVGNACGPACKCLKEKCNKSRGPPADTSLPHHTYTSEEIPSLNCEPTVLHTHTPEDINSDSEYTSEEMSSECGENESNKDEDEAQCLEVDDPEIDDIMREVFGDDNMLL